MYAPPKYKVKILKAAAYHKKQYFTTINTYLWGVFQKKSYIKLTEEQQENEYKL